MNDAAAHASGPEILAPAGDREAFLAALAAGADAVYCGLKHFSARMAAQNFSLDELARLTTLAHRQAVKVYVAFNSLVRPDELEQVGGLVAALCSSVRPDALIVQDLSLISMARRVGFTGQIHLSTLANVSFPAALPWVAGHLGVQRVVVPRELSIDEIKLMADACPAGLSLEVFVHGALCYGVSGRCYWSSYLGGRSGLRGRCVQPCRRIYRQGDKDRRFFSCQDLSLDVLVKLLADVPQVSGWKIEGRKKSAHYVYHTVKAYRMLRDAASFPDARAEVKREALALLSMALGRTANHFRFLPQRPWHPIQTAGQTGSGLLVGRLAGASRAPHLVTREALFAGDLLRIGYEDDAQHATIRVKRFVPARGRLHLGTLKKSAPDAKPPVFLIDRRSDELSSQLEGQARQLEHIEIAAVPVQPMHIQAVRRRATAATVVDMTVSRRPGRPQASQRRGVWLSAEALAQTPPKHVGVVWWWLPPVVWPDDQAGLQRLIDDAGRRGARHFVINAPWQASLVEGQARATLWAGPFCNLANPSALAAAADVGMAGAVVSPELGGEDLLALPGRSPLALGIVVAGSWPLCISRILAEDAKTELPLLSPRREGSWVSRHGPDYWLYPDWQVDLSAKRKELLQAGYRLFVSIEETLPRGMRLKRRPGLWNWSVGLR